MARFVSIAFFCLIAKFGFSQTKFIDGRVHNYCKSCQSVIENKPKEVLFGVHVKENGDVFFSMSDKNWFEKLFKNNSYGVTIDIVSKNRYTCTTNSSEKTSIPRGVFIPAMYKNDLLANSEELVAGGIYTKLGCIPDHLKGQQLEGNLVILNGNYICYYTNLVDIDRNSWQLLPMGLFTDSLVSQSINPEAKKESYFTYTEKIRIEIPFSKGSSAFNQDSLTKYLDSLKLTSKRIKKVEVRAYSSIEGPEAVNKRLMSKRAENIITSLKIIDTSLKRISVITAENWVDFFKDIKDTKFDDLEDLTKFEVKQQLADKNVLSEIEPILASHRKVIATLYIEGKSLFYTETDSSILGEFKKAILSKNISRAQVLQKEIADRISDNKLPFTYISKIEIPKSKEYSPILNDREVYKYLLKATDEYEAFENFMEIKEIDPDNGRLNYNICALRFFMWQYGNDSLSKAVLLNEIGHLHSHGIPLILTERMNINYYILKSEDQLRAFDYAGKDSSMQEIKYRYDKISASDEDIFSLAKYYCYYSHPEWALEIIEPKIASINVNEDLLFYYLNLLFFHPDMYGTDAFKNAALNAININNQRFCSFFRPNDKGGASMQLLEYEEIKKFYCGDCVR